MDERRQDAPSLPPRVPGPPLSLIAVVTRAVYTRRAGVALSAPRWNRIKRRETWCAVPLSACLRAAPKPRWTCAGTKRRRGCSRSTIQDCQPPEGRVTFPARRKMERDGKLPRPLADLQFLRPPGGRHSSPEPLRGVVARLPSQTAVHLSLALRHRRVESIRQNVPAG